MEIPKQKGSAHAEESPVFFDSSGKFITQEECKEAPPSLEDRLPHSCDLTSAEIKGDGGGGNSIGVTVSKGEGSISSIVTSCDDSGVSCDESSRSVTPLMLVGDESSRSLLSCETSSRSLTPSGQSCDASSRSITPLALLQEDSMRSITPVNIAEDTPKTEDCDMVLVFNDEGGAYEEVKGDAVICNKKKKTSKSVASSPILQPDRSESVAGKLSGGRVSLLGGETEVGAENKVDSTQRKACIDVGKTVPSEETGADPSWRQKEKTNEGGKAGREVSPGKDEGTSNILAGEKEADCKSADEEFFDAKERAAADVTLAETEAKVEPKSVVSSKKCGSENEGSEIQSDAKSQEAAIPQIPSDPSKEEGDATNSASLKQEDNNSLTSPNQEEKTSSLAHSVSQPEVDGSSPVAHKVCSPEETIKGSFVAHSVSSTTGVSSSSSVAHSVSSQQLEERRSSVAHQVVAQSDERRSSLVAHTAPDRQGDDSTSIVHSVRSEPQDQGSTVAHQASSETSDERRSSLVAHTAPSTEGERCSPVVHQVLSEPNERRSSIVAHTVRGELSKDSSSVSHSVCSQPEKSVAQSAPPKAEENSASSQPSSSHPDVDKSLPVSSSLHSSSSSSHPDDKSLHLPDNDASAQTGDMSSSLTHSICSQGGDSPGSIIIHAAAPSDTDTGNSNSVSQSVAEEKDKSTTTSSKTPHVTPTEVENKVKTEAVQEDKGEDKKKSNHSSPKTNSSKKPKPPPTKKSAAQAPPQAPASPSKSTASSSTPVGSTGAAEAVTPSSKTDCASAKKSVEESSEKGECI